MSKNGSCNSNMNANAAAGGGIYGLGLLGAIVYYMIHAANFWMVLLGLLKAIIWPAMVVYGILDFLNY